MIAYNFILIMTNMGMRLSEARNLLWHDVSSRQDKQGRRFVVLNVRRKGKHRSLADTFPVRHYRANAFLAKGFDETFRQVNAVEMPGVSTILILQQRSKKRNRNRFPCYRQIQNIDVRLAELPVRPV